MDCESLSMTFKHIVQFLQHIVLKVTAFAGMHIKGIINSMFALKWFLNTNSI